jgi:hypothetical protein
MINKATKVKTLHVVISEENEHAVTDTNARAWYLALKDNDVAYVATSAMFGQIRLGVRLGEVKPFSTNINGEVVHCGNNGQLDSWPIGFMDEQAISIKALMKGIPYEQSKEENDDFRKSKEKPRG